MAMSEPIKPNLVSIPREPPLAFNRFVMMIARGDLHENLSNALQELNAAMNQYVQDYGGVPKGKLEIKFDFKLDKGVFIVEATHKVTMPKRPAQAAFLWSTAGNNFAPQDPRQRDMFSGSRGPAAT